MKELLNAMVQAVGDQAIALGTVADNVTALKQMLARKFPELADDLNGQIDVEQEKNRNEGYELQVSLAKLREMIAQLPDAPTRETAPEEKRVPAVAKRKAKKVAPAAAG